MIVCLPQQHVVARDQARRAVRLELRNPDQHDPRAHLLHVADRLSQVLIAAQQEEGLDALVGREEQHVADYSRVQPLRPAAHEAPEPRAHAG